MFQSLSLSGAMTLKLPLSHPHVEIVSSVFGRNAKAFNNIVIFEPETRLENHDLLSRTIVLWRVLASPCCYVLNRFREIISTTAGKQNKWRNKNLRAPPPVPAVSTLDRRVCSPPLHFCVWFNVLFSFEQQTVRRNDNLTSLKMHSNSRALEASISK